jgi:hypothetical protein
MEDHRMKGNMHQAKFPKRCSTREKATGVALCSTSRHSHSIRMRTSRKPGLALKHPDRRNKVG